MLEFEEMSSRLQEIESCDVGCHKKILAVAVWNVVSAGLQIWIYR